MRIHLIAIGGAAMHNLALALYHNHHTVSGSDDEIYNPARDRLAKFGLLPEQEGWFPEKITPDIDVIILGMHARKDNPELAKAIELGLPVYSYPEFIYHHALHKTRVVIAGSHGKTTTTAMIIHALKQAGMDYDYLVGAQLEGFDTMVKLSDAPVMVIEGDEYPASPIDLVPKILHYHPHVAVLTGIAWDHINVFPTFELYCEQFAKFLATIEPSGSLAYFEPDPEIAKILPAADQGIEKFPYQALPAQTISGQTWLEHPRVPLQVFGQHNLANLHAAWLVCKQLGVSQAQFFEAAQSFRGAAKRLQLLHQQPGYTAYLDFAHAPSKVKATTEAVKSLFPERRLIACIELHTFSSLNKAFHPHYAHTLDAAEQAVVFYSEHTLEMKRLPALDPDEVKAHFQHPNLSIITQPDDLKAWLARQDYGNTTLLLMTSGTFGGLNLKEVAADLGPKES